MKHYKPSGGKAKKRLLALVLALAVVCSSLMSVYANGVATMDMDMGFGVDDGFGVDVQMDDGFAVTPEEEEEDLDLAPGIHETTDDFGNTVITWGKDTWNQWDDDGIASPYPDGEQMDPGFAIPTITYRFWLTEKDSAELDAFNAEVASGVKLYGMTEAEYIDLYGPNDGMFSAVHIADGGSLWDNSFKNPTAADAPNAGKPNFAGWYTVDEYGYQRKFTFDTSCDQTYVEAGVVHAAKSATVDVFAKWSANATDTASQPITNPNFDDTLDDHTYDKWYAALVSSSDSAFQGLLEKYTDDEGFCEYLDNLPEDEIQYLSEKLDETATTIPESQETVDRGTVSIKQGYSQVVLVSNETSVSVSNYSCSENGITVTSYSSSSGTKRYGYKISVGSSVPAGEYTLTVTYKCGNSTATDTVVVRVLNTTEHIIVTNNMENTEVAYISFNGSTTNYNLTPIADGAVVQSSGSEGVLVFFIKPKDGYLLTEFVNVSGAACDLYSVNIDAKNSAIMYFRDENNVAKAQIVLDNAKNQGYLGYYGFTYSGKYAGTQAYSTKAERPQMVVTAVANPATGVKPGDTVTYTVTITPGHTSAKDDKVTKVEIKSLTINGQDEQYSNLQANTDGTYTTTVTHTVTQADWESGDVSLKVEASVDYTYKITVKDRGVNGEVTESDIDTDTTVPNTAEVSVQVAPKTGVKYHVTYEPSDLTLPASIATVPYDTNEYFADETVNVNTTYGTNSHATGEPANVVDDPTNGGTWTFNGWYKDEALSQKANATETMVEGGLNFYGKWTFTKYPNTTVTITKKVTGFFGERNKDFTFTVSVVDTDNKFVTTGITAKKGETELENWNSFTLKNGETIVLSGVPIDAQITVKETDADDYGVSAMVGTTTLTKADDENAFTYIVVDANSDAELNHITVTNHKTADIDAGIDLGSATPYLFLLCVAAVGVATLKRKRER